jgi:citrate synthase
LEQKGQEEQVKIYKGLDGVLVKKSSICYIDGKNSRLYYRGYSVEELAKYSNFEETAYLLLFGKLPTKRELDNFKYELAERRHLQKKIISLLNLMPEATRPIDVLRTAVSALSIVDPHPYDSSWEKNLERGIDVIAKMPTIIATFDRLRRGLKVIKPNLNLNHAENFLYMLTGKKPNKYDAKILDLCFLLHVEHELNASTFSAMVTISSLSDMYSAITSAIGTLKGHLHGAANEAALSMFLEVGEPDRAEEYVESVINGGRRIMGFGHRIYRNYDPRHKILKEVGKELSKLKGKQKLFEIAMRVEEAALKRLMEKKLFPNVDFSSGVVFYLLGIPRDLFTAVFASSRVVGWVAHCLEYLKDNRLIRPKAYYEGQLDLKYVPIEQRG